MHPKHAIARCVFLLVYASVAARIREPVISNLKLCSKLLNAILESTPFAFLYLPVYEEYPLEAFNVWVENGYFSCRANTNAYVRRTETN